VADVPNGLSLTPPQETKLNYVTIRFVVARIFSLLSFPLAMCIVYA
jgi:hypothetical protein